MTEAATEQTATATETTEQTPAAKKTLADTLASLADEDRDFVLGEVTKARNEAKSLRDRLKPAETKAAQFDELQQAQQTAEQKAQQQAQELQARALESMHKAARTTVKTALSGVVDDPESIIDDLNIAKFVNDDGEIDEDAVTALRERYAALGGGKPRTPAPNRAQGAAGAPALQPRDQFAALIHGAVK